MTEIIEDLNSAALVDVVAKRRAPSVSVVICAFTEQRWLNLVESHDSIRRQLDDDDEVIVVIDHNETLLGRARGRFATAQVLPNFGAPGLSAARNTGVQASTRDVVAFLDDDASARAGWMDEIRTAFMNPVVAVVGTRVVPLWEGDEPPKWFPEEFGWVVGCGYRGQPTQPARIRNPIGASMAVRRSVFDVIGGFADAVGRVGNLPTGCDETELCIRLAQQMPGAEVVYSPAAAVDHFVPRSRQTLKYFSRRCFHEGRSKFRVSRLRGADSALSVERDYVYAVLTRAVLRGLRPAAMRGGSGGFPKAATVVWGLTATVSGFAYELFSGKR